MRSLTVQTLTPGKGLGVRTKLEVVERVGDKVVRSKRTPPIASSAPSRPLGCFVYTPASPSQEQTTQSSQEAPLHTEHQCQAAADSPLRNSLSSTNPLLRVVCDHDHPLQKEVHLEVRRKEIAVSGCIRAAGVAATEVNENVATLLVGPDGSSETVTRERPHPNPKASSTFISGKLPARSLPIFPSALGREIDVLKISVTRAALLLSSETPRTSHENPCTAGTTAPAGGSGTERGSELQNDNACRSEASLLAALPSSASEQIHASHFPGIDDRAGGVVAAHCAKEVDTGPKVSEVASKTCVSSLPTTPSAAPTTAQAATDCFPMFKTAGRGKRVDISDENLARAAVVLSEKSFSSKRKTISKPGLPTPHRSRVAYSGGLEEVAIESSVSGPPVFTTGLGRKVEVSEASLERASSLLSTESSTRVGGHDSETCPSTTPYLPTFKTAGRGKKVEVSEASLTRATSILSTELSANRGHTAPGPPPAHRARVSFGGEEGAHAEVVTPGMSELPLFTTGLGKKVDVSVARLARAASVLTTETSSSTIAHSTTAAPPQTALGAPTFTTAGRGKKMEVSGACLARAASLLSSNTDRSHQNHVHCAARAQVSFGVGMPYDDPSDRVPDACCPRTSTAGLGKEVDASEASLTRSTNFLPTPASSNTRGTLVGSLPSSTLLPSFTTAGHGKKVEVSDASLVCVASLLTSEQEISSNNYMHGAPRSFPVRPARVSFGTAEESGLPLTAAKREMNMQVSEKSPARATDQFPPIPTPTLGTTDGSPSGTPAFSGAKTSSRETCVKLCGASVARAALSVSSSKKHIPETPEPFLGLRTCTPGFSKNRDNAARIGSNGHGSEAHSDSARFQGMQTKACCDALASISHGNLPPTFQPESECRPASKATNRSESATRGNNSHVVSVAHTTQLVSDQIESGTHSGTRSFLEAIIDGGMANYVEESLQHGASCSALAVDSTSGLRVLYDRKTSLPCIILPSTNSGSPPNVEVLGSPTDFRDALSCLGCDSSIISDKWILNHARWIVWKLAAIERRFARHLATNCLTFPRVVEQLKFRFEREILSGDRSSLRRILNRDASAERMIVLCVSLLHKVIRSNDRGDVAHDEYFCELTDGWYPVRAVLDARLCHFVREGRIRLGTKLMVSAASLVGFDDGVDPLDVIYDTASSESSPALCVAANSCRIARWNAKLGFVHHCREQKRDEGVLRVRKISDIYEDGGKVPLIDLVVLRKHPVSFLNKAPNSSKSHILSLSEELERLRQLEKDRQSLVDHYADEIEAECALVRISACFARSPLYHC